VILETDQALAALLKAKAFGDAAIGIAFDQPTKAWSQSVTGPTVNLFLFDVKENTHRRDVMYEEVRDADGTLVARRPPPRRFDLHYTVTGWAPKALMEHNLLGVVLRCFAAFDIVPRELLPAALAELPYEVLLGVGAGTKRSMLLSLGGEQKACFDLCVTVAVPPLQQVLVPPPVQEPPKFEMKPTPAADPARTVSSTETVQAAPSGTAGAGQGEKTQDEKTEGDKAQDDKNQRTNDQEGGSTP
jgi:hypothetical protein